MSIQIKFYPQHSEFAWIEGILAWIEGVYRRLDENSEARIHHEFLADVAVDREDYDFHWQMIENLRIERSGIMDEFGVLGGAAFWREGRAIVAEFPNPSPLQRQWQTEARALAEAHRKRVEAAAWASECSLARRVRLKA